MILNARISLIAMAALSLCAEADAQKPLDDSLPPGAVARIGDQRFRGEGCLRNVFFSADGKLAIGLGERFYVWDAATGKRVADWSDPKLFDINIDPSPDGKFVAAVGHDASEKTERFCRLVVFDVATRKPLWTKFLDGEPQNEMAHVRFSLDGKHIFTLSSDLRIWDAASGQEVRREKLKAHQAGLSLSPDGNLLAIGSGTGLHIWDWRQPAAPRLIDTGFRKWFQRIGFSRDGKTVCTMDYPDFRSYDAATGKLAGRVDDSVFQSVSISPDSKTTAESYYDKAKGEGAIVLRDRTSGKETSRIPAGKAGLTSLRWSPDGKRIATVGDFRVWIWDVETRKPVGFEVPKTNEMQVTSMVFAANGQLVASGGTIQVWDATSGKQLREIRPEERSYRVEVSPDGGLIASTGSPNHVSLWDAKSGREQFKLRWSAERSGGVFHVRFTDDEQRVLTFGADCVMRTWDCLTGKVIAEKAIWPEKILGPPGDEEDNERKRDGIILFEIRTCQFSRDGKLFFLPYGDEIAAYDSQTGKERFKLSSDEQNARQLCLSPDGRFLASAGTVKVQKDEAFSQIFVWELAQGKEKARFRIPGDSYREILSFTPDGKFLVSQGRSENSLAFWDAAGKPAGTLPLPHAPRRIAFDGGKRLAVSFSDTTILIYDWKAALKPVKE